MTPALVSLLGRLKPQILSLFKNSGLDSRTHSLKFETPLCKFNRASPDEHSGHLSAKRLVILLLVSRTPKSRSCKDVLCPSIMKTPATLPENYDSLPGLDVDELWMRFWVKCVCLTACISVFALILSLVLLRRGQHSFDDFPFVNSSSQVAGLSYLDPHSAWYW